MVKKEYYISEICAGGREEKRLDTSIELVAVVEERLFVSLVLKYFFFSLLT